jgi:hypothetical protein
VQPVLGVEENTRSSAQVWRTATNTNSRPGWNGGSPTQLAAQRRDQCVFDDAG